MGRFVREIQVAKALTQTPKSSTATEKSRNDTTGSRVFIDVERGVSSRVSVTHIDAGKDGFEIFEFHPKRTIVGIDKSYLLGNRLVLFPQLGLVAPGAFPFVRTPRIA